MTRRRLKVPPVNGMTNTVQIEKGPGRIDKSKAPTANAAAESTGGTRLYLPACGSCRGRGSIWKFYRGMFPALPNVC